MGAINYGCSDIINIGVNPAIYDNMSEDEREISQNDDFLNAEYIVQKYDFCYLSVCVKSGYYDGFYISIEDPGYMYFDCKEEKREFIRELTQLKKMLLELAGIGLVRYSPGWCTGYYTERETVRAIRDAIRYAKLTANSIPCYRTWERMGRGA